MRRYRNPRPDELQMRPDAEGEWVRHEEVAAAVADERAVVMAFVDWAYREEGWVMREIQEAVARGEHRTRGPAVGVRQAERLSDLAIDPNGSVEPKRFWLGGSIVEGSEPPTCLCGKQAIGIWCTQPYCEECLDKSGYGELIPETP